MRPERVSVGEEGEGHSMLMDQKQKWCGNQQWSLVRGYTDLSCDNTWHIHVTHTQTLVTHTHTTHATTNIKQTKTKIIQKLDHTFKMRTFSEDLFHLENGWSSPKPVSNHKSWYRWIISGYIVGISNLQSGKTPTLVFAKSENTMLISFKNRSIFHKWKWYSYTVWTSDLRFLLGLLPLDKNFLEKNNFHHFQPSCNITDSIQSHRKWKDQWQLIMMQSFEVLT